MKTEIEERQLYRRNMPYWICWWIELGPVLGWLSPPLPTTSIGHNRMATTVLTRRVCRFFGRVLFDNDSAAEDYAMVAVARRIHWDVCRLISIRQRAPSAVADRGYFCVTIFKRGGGSKLW